MHFDTLIRVPSGRQLFGATLVFVFVLFLLAATRPLNWLIGVVPDDAFYYLQIARYIARTGISTFDGLNVTNGYHPGWMAVLVACAKFCGDQVGLLRIGLFAAFSFHVAASVCLACALRRWTTPNRAWTGGAIWLINLLPLRLALQSMEASFYIFGLAVALLVYAARIATRQSPSVGQPSSLDFALFGLSLSLCFWGRTEAIVLVVVLTIALAWAFRASCWPRALLVTGAAFGAGVAPWLLFSRIATGSFIQHSGAMKMLWASEAHVPLAARTWRGVQFFVGSWLSYPIVGALGEQTHGLRGITNAAATIAMIALLVLGLRKKSTRMLAAAGAAALLGTLLTGGVYAAVFTDTQFWYKAQPGFVLFVILYQALAEAVRTIYPSSERIIVGVVIGVMGGLAIQLLTLAPYPWQRDVLASQKQFDDLVPTTAVIGCFNAGIPGYFGRRTVVNVDGLVNNSIYRYYREHEVERYWRDAHIAYLADETDALTRALKFTQRQPSLTVIARAPLSGWKSHYRFLWRLNPDSAAVKLYEREDH